MKIMEYSAISKGILIKQFYFTFLHLVISLESFQIIVVIQCYTWRSIF